jgi:hypothetical protein
LLYTTVLVDYLEGSPDDYFFDPPPAAAGSGTTGGNWSGITGRKVGARGSIDEGFEPEEEPEEAMSPTVQANKPKPGARRICLPGVSNFTQFQTRLFSTAVEQLTLIRNDFRQSLRFLLLLLHKIVENGVNKQLQDVLTRLNFNDYYNIEG